MELIIKPTAKCNMACKFCAASEIKTNDKDSINKIFNIISVLNPDSLIFTGGDPLCMTPEYYFSIIERYPDLHMSMTTNLKDFYLNPSKWMDLLKHPNVSICTSFNYGSTRMWDKETVYSEDVFLEVVDTFNKYIGYVPSFISVIDYDNADTVLDTVKLAKRLGTKCRINNAMKIGRQGIYYPRYKIFQHWLDIIDAGLENYEINCSERFIGKCPINSNLLCGSTIRSVYVDHDNRIRYSNCEDKLNMDLKDIPIDKERPDPITQIIPYQEVIDSKCFSCELCNICNACEMNRIQAKECFNYCNEMLKLKERILEAGWKA